MSWAATEWKDGLPHRALQKIGDLEKQLEKLQKERQQKQFHMDSLEQAFEKQKRKVEEEKSAQGILQRENQSLIESCDELQRRIQKWEHELQTKDHRIACLETQLGQAKSSLGVIETNGKKHGWENGQQVGMAAQKLEKDNQHTAELEATVERLKAELECANKLGKQAEEQHIPKEQAPAQKLIEPDKSTASNEKTSLMIQMKDKEIETLKKSVSEIQTELNHATKSLEQKEINVQQMKQELRDFKIQSEELTLKMTSLEEKNRRVLGDLECQRHNAEAARQAAENRWKEKEKEHKAELSHQTDTVRDMQRLLDEQEKKHQQEINKTRGDHGMIQSKLERAEVQYVSQEKELKETRQKLDAADNALQSREAQAVQLEATLEQLKKEKGNLLCRVDELSRLLETTKKNGEDAARRLDLREEHLSNLEEKLQKQAEGLKKMEQQNVEFRREMDFKTSQLSQKTTEAETAKEKVLALESKAVELKDKLDAQNTAMQTRVTEIGQLSAELASTKEMLTDTKKTLDTSSQKADTLVSSVKEDLARANADKEDLKKEVNKLAVTVESKDQELEQISVQLKDITQQRENLAQESLSGKTLVDELRQSLAGLNEKNAQLNAHCSTLEEDFKSTQLKLEAVSQKSEALVGSLKSEKEQLQGENTALKSEVQQLSCKVDASQKDTEELRGQLRDISSQNAQFLQDAEQNKTKISDLESKLQQVSSEKQQLTGKLETVEDLLKEANKEHTASKEKLESFTNELKDGLSAEQSKNSSLIKDNKEVQAKLEQNKLDINNLNSNLKDLSLQKEQIMQERGVLKTTVKTLQSDFEQLSKVKQQLDGKLETAGDELKLLKEASATSKQKSDSLVGELKADMIKLQEEKHVLQSDVDQMSLKLEARQGDIEEVRVQLNDISVKKLQIEQECEQHKCAVKLLENNARDMRTEREELKKSLVIVEDELKVAQETSITLQQKSDDIICQLRSEVAEKSLLVSSIKAEVDQLASKLEATMKEMENISTELKETCLKKSQVEQEAEKYKVKIDELQTQLNAVSSEKAATETKTETLEDQLKTLRDQNISAQCKAESLVAEYKAETVQLKEERSCLKSEIEQMGFKLGSSQEDCENLGVQLGELGAKKAQLEQDIEQQKILNKDLQNQLQDLTSHLQALEEKSETMRSAIKEEKELHETSRLKSESVITDLRAEVSRLNDEKHAIQAEIQKLSMDLLSSQEDAENVRSELKKIEGKKAQIEQEAGEQKIANATQASNLHELTTERDKIQGQLESVQDALKTAEHKQVEVLDKSTAVIGELKADLTKEKDQQSLLQAELEQLRFKLESSQEDMEEVVSQLNELSAKKVLNEQESGQLKAQINSLQHELEELASAKQQLEGKLELVKDELKSEKEELLTLKQKSESLVMDLRRELAAVQEEKSILQSDVTQMSFKLESGQEDVEILSVQFKEVAAKKTQVEQECQQQKASIANLETHLEEAMSSKQQLEGRLEVLEDDLAVVQKELVSCQQKSDAAISKQKAENASLQNDCSKLKMEIDELTVKLEANHKDIDFERQTLKEAKEREAQLHQKCSQQKDTIDSLNCQLGDLSKEKKALEGQVELSTDEVKDLKNQIEVHFQKSEGLLVDLKERNLKLENKNSELTTQVQEMTFKLDSSLEDLECMASTLKVKSEQLEQLKQECLQQKDSFHALQQERDNLQKSEMQLNKILESAQLDLKTVEADRESWNVKSGDMIASLQKDLDASSQHKEKLKQEVDVLTHKLDTAEHCRQESSEQLKKMNEKEIHLRQECAEQKEKICVLVEEVSKLNTTKDELGGKLELSENHSKQDKEKLESLRLKCDSMETKLKEKVEMLETEKQNLKTELQQTAFAAENKQEDLDDMSSTLQQITENLDKLKQESAAYQKQVQTLQVELHEERVSKTALSTDLAELQEGQEEWKKMKAEFVQERQNLCSQIQHMHTEHKSLELKLKETEDDVINAQTAAENLSDKNQELVEQGETLKSALEGLEGQVAKLEEVIVVRDNKLCSLEEILKQKECEIEQLKTDLEEVEEVLTGSQRSGADQLHEKNRQLEKVQERLDDALADVMQLRNELATSHDELREKQKQSEITSTQLQEKIDDLLSNKEQLLQHIRHLESCTCENDIKISALKAEIDQHELEKEQSLELHQKALEACKEMHQKACNKLLSQLEELQESRDKARKDTENNISKMYDMEKDWEFEKSQMKNNLESERSKMLQMQSELETQNELTRTKEKALEEEHNFCLTQQEERCQKLEKELAETKQSLCVLKDTLNQTSAQTCQEVANLQAERDELVNLRDELEEKLAALEQQSEQLKTKLEENIAHEKTVRAAHACELQEWANKEAELKSELDLVGVKLSEAETASRKLEGVVSNLETLRDSYEVKIKEKETDMLEQQQVVCDLKANISCLESEKETLNQKVENGEKHTSEVEEKLQSKIDGMNRLLEVATENLQKETEKLGDMELQVLTLTEANKTTTEQHEVEMRCCQSEICALKEGLRKTEAEVDTKRAEIDQLEVDLKDVSSRLEVTEGELNTLKDSHCLVKKEFQQKLDEQQKQHDAYIASLGEEHKFAMTAAEESRSEVETTLENVKRELGAVKGVMSETAAQKCQEVAKLQDERNELVNLRDGLEEKLAALEQHSEHLKIKLEEKIAHEETVRATHACELQEWANKEAELKSELDLVGVKLSEAEIASRKLEGVVSDLETLRDSYEVRIKEKETEMLEQQQVVCDLKANISCLETEKEKLNQKVENGEKHTSEVEEKLQSKIDGMNRLLEVATENLQKETEKLGDMELQVLTLTEANKTTTEQHEVEMRCCQSEICALKEGLRKTEAEVDTKRAEIDQLEVDLKDVSSRLEVTEGELNTLRDSHCLVKKELQQKLDEQQKQHDAYIASLGEEHKFAMTAAEESRSEVETTLENVKRELGAVKGVMSETAAQKCQEVAKLQDERNELVNLRDGLKEKLAALEQRSEHLKIKLEEKIAHEETVRATHACELQEWANKEAELKSELDLVGVKLSKAEIASHKLEGVVSNLETLRDSYEVKIKEKETDMLEQQQVVCDLKANISCLETEKEKLNQKVENGEKHTSEVEEKLQSKIDGMNRLLEVATENLQKETEKLGDMELQVLTLTEANKTTTEQHEVEMRCCQSEICALKEGLRKTEAEVDTKRAEIDQLEVDLKDVSSQLEVTEGELNTLRDSHCLVKKELQQKLDEQQKQHDAYIASLEEEHKFAMTAAEESRSEVETTLENVKRELAPLKQHSEHLKTKLEEKIGHEETVRAAHACELQEWANKEAELKSELDLVGVKLSEAEAATTKLEGVVSNLETLRDSYEVKIKEKETEMLEQQQVVCDLKANISHLETEQDKLSQEARENVQNEMQKQDVVLSDVLRLQEQLAASEKDLNERIQLHEADSLEASEKLNEVQNIASTLERELKTVKEAFEMQASEQENHICELKTQNQELQNKLDNLQDSLLFLQDSQTAHVEAKSEEISSLKLKLSDIESNFALQEDLLTETSMKLDETLEDLNEKCREAECLQAEIKNMKNVQFEFQDEVDKGRDEWKDKLNDKTAEIQNLQEEMAAVESSLEISKSRQDNLAHECATLQVELEVLKESEADLQKQVGELKNQVRNAKEMTLSSTEEIETLHQEVKQLKQTRADLERQIGSTQDDLMQTQTFSQSVKSQLDEKEVELSSMALAKEDLHQEVEALTRDLRELKDMMENKETEVSDCKGELYNLSLQCTEGQNRLQESEAQREELAQKMVEFEDHVSDVQRERDDLRTKVQETEAEVQGLKGQAELLQEQYMDLQHTFKSATLDWKENLLLLQQDLRSKDDKLKNLQKEIDDEKEKSAFLEESNQDLDQAMEQLREDLAIKQNAASTMESQIKTLSEELKEQKASLSAFQNTCQEKDQLTKQVNQLLDELDVVRRQNAELQAGHSKTKTDFEGREQELSERTAQLERQLQILTSEKNALQSEKDALQSQEIKNVAHIQQRDAELEELKLRSVGLNTERSQLENELKILSSEMELIKNEKEAIALKGEECLVQLQGECNEKHAKMTKLEVEKSALEARTDEMSQLINELQQQLATLNEKQSEFNSLKVKEESILHLETQLKRSKDECCILQKTAITFKAEQQRKEMEFSKEISELKTKLRKAATQQTMVAEKSVNLDKKNIELTAEIFKLKQRIEKIALEKLALQKSVADLKQASPEAVSKNGEDVKNLPSSQTTLEEGPVAVPVIEEEKDRNGEDQKMEASPSSMMKTEAVVMDVETSNEQIGHERRRSQRISLKRRPASPAVAALSAAPQNKRLCTGTSHSNLQKVEGKIDEVAVRSRSRRDLTASLDAEKGKVQHTQLRSRTSLLPPPRSQSRLPSPKKKVEKTSPGKCEASAPESKHQPEKVQLLAKGKLATFCHKPGDGEVVQQETAKGQLVGISEAKFKTEINFGASSALPKFQCQSSQRQLSIARRAARGKVKENAAAQAKASAAGQSTQSATSQSSNKDKTEVASLGARVALPKFQRQAGSQPLPAARKAPGVEDHSAGHSVQSTTSQALSTITNSPKKRAPTAGVSALVKPAYMFPCGPEKTKFTSVIQTRSQDPASARAGSQNPTQTRRFEPPSTFAQGTTGMRRLPHRCVPAPTKTSPRSSLSLRKASSPPAQKERESHLPQPPSSDTDGKQDCKVQ